MKTCTICKTPKELTEFYTCRTTKDKHWGQCKKCAGKRTKLMRQNLSKEEKDRRINLGTNRRHCKREASLLNQTRYRAHKMSIPFNIELSDIVIPERCLYLNIPLFHGSGKLSDHSPSLDKIIPELGYIKGNIQIISHKANSMKRNATPAELKLFATKILEQFGEK